MVYLKLYAINNNIRFQVFQQRQDGSVDFYRTWQEYKDGFGNASSEYWLGMSMVRRYPRNPRGTEYVFSDIRVLSIEIYLLSL